MRALVANALSSIPISQIAAPLLVLLVLGLMLLPLPPLALDIFFTFNIGVSMIILLTALQLKSFKDMVAFPTILLVTTLLRLSLNVASTRVVLMQGHTGPDAAGKVIESFAQVLVGGNYVVGVIVFIVVTIINFVVITKGAGRVAEVSARFTLDAMPGKQMAIDADLNAGIIRDDEAKRRRADVAQEADFYGSMDGASKFVRGDAIAGIIILIINLLGGIAVGMLQFDLPFMKALETYATLAVGDGLVAQVPALIVSTAAGVVVTRVATDEDFGAQVASQLGASAFPLFLAAIILAVLGVIPGMPHFAFLTFAVAFAAVGYALHRRAKAELQRAATVEAAAKAPSEEVNWSDVPVVEPLSLELGYRLIRLVDAGDQSDLIKRIRAIRKKFVAEVGFLIPSVHVRDNLQLPPENYRFMIFGAEVARGQILPDRFLAIEPATEPAHLDGVRVLDPTFKMPAVWIYPNQRDSALSKGYTVVEPSVVLATHLDQIVRMHAHELLGRQEVQDLVDHFRARFPKLVEDTVPKNVSLQIVQKMLQLLLEEGIPIRDFRTVLEVAAEQAGKDPHPLQLLAPLRFALRRTIVQEVFGDAPSIRVAAVHPDFERIIEQAVGNLPVAPDGAIEPGLMRFYEGEVTAVVDDMETLGLPPVIVASARNRLTLSRIARKVRPQAVVLGMNEMPVDADLSFHRVICSRQGASQ
ncbi:MAG: flagellar biosynthesis protein FlhA [Betaproteobacteria bacterium]|nr:flagellar biosynthesis protein FlhA [Betaproteobacteria bacterium]